MALWLMFTPRLEAWIDVRVTHRMIDQDIGKRVADRRFRPARVEASERRWIAAFLFGSRPDLRQDRLAGNPHVQRGEVLVGIEAGGELALSDRMIPTVRHVLFAPPQQLDRRAGHLHGD